MQNLLFAQPGQVLISNGATGLVKVNGLDVDL